MPSDLHSATLSVTSQPKSWRTAGVVFLLIVAAVEFTVRGPLRIGHSPNWNDFISPYIQSNIWLHGEDPYRSENLVRFWPPGIPMPTFVLRESVDERLVKLRGVPSPYPPTSFVLLAPLSLLPWKAALWIWIAVSLCAVAAMILAVAGVAGIQFNTPRGLAFLALCLGLAPIHTGLATANSAIVGIGLSLVAVWLADRHDDWAAGLMIAASVCLKPPIGLCFLFFYLVERRWKICKVAGVLSAVVAIIAMGRMWAAGTPALANYRLIAQHMFAPGAINDFTPANPVWFQMLNLQGGVDAIFGNPRTATIAALLAGGLLTILWTQFYLSKTTGKNTLLAVSALAVLSLLPIYHRFYDASLVILPLAWALSPLNEAPSRVKVLTIALITPFFIPGAAVLDQLSISLRGRSALIGGRWWNGLIMPHEAWFLLLLSILLLWAMTKPFARQGPEAYCPNSRT